MVSVDWSLSIVVIVIIREDINVVAINDSIEKIDYIAYLFKILIQPTGRNSSGTVRSQDGSWFYKW